jgi:hypothetical protein
MILLAESAGEVMQGFVQGADRQPTTLLPECLDDWVGESNSIRAVDVFVTAAIKSVSALSAATTSGRGTTASSGRARSGHPRLSPCTEKQDVGAGTRPEMLMSGSRDKPDMRWLNRHVRS